MIGSLNDLVFHNDLASRFFPALLFSLFLTPFTIRFSNRFNAVDYPGDLKIHSKPVTRLGGVAVAAGVFVTLLYFEKMDRTLAAFLSGALLVVLTGFLDDLYHIPPVAKFIGEVLGAGVFVLLSGTWIAEFGDLFGSGVVRAGVLAPAITVFCMVGVMNALNLSDGLDGLAGGISAIACVFLGTFAYINQHWLPLHVLLALLGALLGFLRYNTYPANLFMGDTGSLLLGYALSAACVLMVQNDGMGLQLSPVTVAGVVALPIMDTLMVMWGRLSRGENPFLPDKTHLHHRLLDMGFPHTAVVSILYVSTAVFGAQAWVLRGRPDWMRFFAVLLLGVGIYGTVFLLRKIGYRWKGGEERKDDHYGKGPAYSFISKVMGKSIRHMGWVIGFGLGVPILVLPSIPRFLGALAIAAGIFVAVLFPWRSRATRSSVCYGLMYLACLFLLAILQLVPGAPYWIPGYLAVLSGVVMCWVLLKMKYQGHREIFRVSSFELLLIGVPMFVPLLLVPALGLGDGLRRMLLTVSLESTAFLLAMKILIRKQTWRNHVIAMAFLAALGLLGVKGLFFGHSGSDSLAAPADFLSPSFTEVTRRSNLRSSSPSSLVPTSLR
jgi:UDP-GlcNAc:undecaprenyl-phosphate/decaprenyl-phosphate GlcNAc-1-phosphate transferase